MADGPSILRANGLKFRIGKDDQQLYMKKGESDPVPVRVRNAFPLTDWGRCVVVEDEEGEMIGLIRDCDELGRRSRREVEAELQKEHFIPRIVRINGISEEFNTMIWDVETDRGSRRFEVKSRRRDMLWFTDFHLVIRDADGNKYQIEDLRALDDVSRERLEIEV